ncbi:DltD domain-containing protein [Colletotrichum asianum]|uniref:AB hydrolase-1 domain-containing protein n=1 Tax=Colletotrichum asianum TaxID=702518 RepID=A0A8H3VV86_9PEZI|nr:hypothetical protein GQ607_017754 [Colletotrichum asianum]
MSENIQRVQFSTLDGLLLQGILYPAKTRGPAIVITPGFNCVKEMFVPEVATEFQKNGITALIYDPRNLGESQGQPRNEVDPAMQISDYSDAITYLRSLSIVDPDSVCIWGQSFAGTIALCAGAMDKRAKLVIAVCPLLSSNLDLTSSHRPKVLSRSMADRESQTAGENPPTYLPVLSATGQNPAGMGLGADKEEFDYMVNAKTRGAPNYENRTTLQSYYKILMWQPHSILDKLLDEMPVLMIVPADDMISPADEQLRLFDTFISPWKKSHVVTGKGHLNVLSGPEFHALAAMQCDYVRAVLQDQRSDSQI